MKTIIFVLSSRVYRILIFNYSLVIKCCMFEPVAVLVYLQGGENRQFKMSTLLLEVYLGGGIKELAHSPYLLMNLASRSEKIFILGP